MNKIIRVFGWCLLFQSALSAQVIGGRHTFSFLSLSPSARVTALGGAQIAVRDDEVAFAQLNPAALNPLMSGRLTFNHNFYLKDIQHGYAAYAHHLPKWGYTVHGAIQYTDYGDIQQADAIGNITGEVKTGETAFTLGAARQLSSRLALGLNMRFSTSRLDSYTANAFTADAGLMYADTARRFTVGLVIRNYGTQIKTYNGTDEQLPNDIQIGFSKRLKHLPFRYTIIAHRLNQWDIRYNDPALKQTDFFPIDGSEPKETGVPVVDNIFRHLIFNGEFLFGKTESFRIRFGYNHLRRKEMSVRNFRSIAGFSGGFGIRVKRFRVDVGYASYHLAGGAVHLGIGTNLGDYF